MKGYRVLRVSQLSARVQLYLYMAYFQYSYSLVCVCATILPVYDLFKSLRA